MAIAISLSVVIALLLRFFIAWLLRVLIPHPLANGENVERL